MNDQPRARLGTEAAQWLADGPTTAPASLLDRATERTRGTRQRAGWVAIALGAVPMPADGLRGRLVSRRAIWLAAAVALLVGAAIIVAAGGISRRDLPVVLAPSTSSAPQPLGTLAPTPGPGPTGLSVRACFMGPTISCDASISDVVEPDLGYTFAGGSEWSIQSTDSITSRSYGVGQCWDGICMGGYLTVSVFQLGAGFTVDPGPGAPSGATSHKITGTTLAKLGASWTKAYPGTAAPTLVDGVDAIVVSTDTNLYVLAIRGSRIYSFMSAGPAFLNRSPRAVLASDLVLSGFLAGFRFLDPTSTNAPS